MKAKTIKNWVSYDKLNFGISVFGFIASLIFYYKVGSEVLEEKPKEKTIKELKVENKKLQHEIDILINQLNQKNHASKTKIESPR